MPMNLLGSITRDLAARSAARRITTDGRALGAACALLFLLGLGLRLWFLAAYRPGFLGFPDSQDYIYAATTRLFEGLYQPAGYPIFLRMVHALSAHLSYTIAVQHLLGLATAALYLLIVRRAAELRWLALIPAAVVLLDGTQVFLEHAVMAEAVFEFLLAVGLYASVRSLERPRAGWWLTAGLALGLATAVRTVGVAIVCLAVLWILLVGRAPDNSRPTVMRFLRSLHMRRAAITAAAAIVLLLYYSDAQGRQTGSYGLTRTAGFNLYLRVSPYYDCTRFTPPAGTQALCAKRAPPPAQYVQGPFLVWCPGYPGLCAFGYPPDANAKLSDFAFAVIAHQPGDYLHAVLKDLGRYIAPPSFYSQTALQRLLHDAANEQAAIPRMAAYYKTAGFTRSDVGALDTYGRIFHIGGIALAIMVAIALASLGLCRGRTRTLAILLTAVGLLLLVAPVITSHYEPRYAVPAYGPLAAAAAFAIEAAIVRRRHAARRQPPAGAAES